MTTTNILAGWLVDGSGGPIQEKVLLRIQDGKFAAIERYSPESGLDLSQVVNLAHCTLLPPLVDSHVHLFMSGTIDKRTRDTQLTAGYEELQPAIARHLHDLFSHGVLAVRDAGDRGDFALRFSDTMGLPPRVSLKVAGRAWHGKGRYGSLIGRTPEPGETLAAAYDRDGGGGEWVKLVNSGLNSLKEFGKETAPQFSCAEISALVQTSALSGKKVMVHANGKEPVRLAVEAGCHSLEHGFFMGRENLERMAEKGTIWVPTVFTMKAFARHSGSADSLADPKVIEKNLNHQLGQLVVARELGVTVALGTDAGSLGVLHGESVFEEMKLFIKAGYSLAQTIRCATSNGARLLGLEDFGLLVKGRTATFLVARGTPAQLPRKLTYLEAMYIAGESTTLYRKNPVKTVRIK